MADIKDEQRKMHGDKLSEVVEGHQADAVPGDDNAHAHSHAAHLGSEGAVHTKAEVNLRQGVEPGALRQPPQDPGRVGKSFRRQ